MHLQLETRQGLLSAWYENGYFKDLQRKTAADKVLPDKPFRSASNPNDYGYQTWVTVNCLHLCDKNFDDTSTHAGDGIVSEYQQLADELHRPIIRYIQRPKRYSAYEDNILGVDLANIQLVIFFFSTYLWHSIYKGKKNVQLKVFLSKHVPERK